MKPINVLSLFGGIECGREALKRAGIPVGHYYSSEVDKYAIKAAKNAHPDIVHVGDVQKVKVKSVLLSEVYAYICGKYFQNESIHGLQGILSEREMLHRLDQEQTMAANFGTQIQDGETQVSEHTALQINESIWFFRNEMGSNESVFDIVRGGERGNKTDKDNGLREHSFWRNGNRQREPGIEAKGIERAAGESCNTRNQGENKGGRQIAVFNERVKGCAKGNRVEVSQESRNKGKVFSGDGKDRSFGAAEKEGDYLRREKGGCIQSIEGKVCAWNELDGVECENRVKRTIYKEIQVTVVECEWGIMIFKGVFQAVYAGSPCQGFSFAGKQLNFNDPRSALFFEFVRILKECQDINPNVLFMLENVPMKKEFQRVINEQLGIMPVNINAALVCAQNRNRLFWSNIRTRRDGLFGELVSDIPQPADKGILLQDVLQKNVDEKYYLSDAAMARIIRTKYSSPKLNPEKTGTINCKNNSGQLQVDSGTTLVGVVDDNGALREVTQSGCIDSGYAKGMDNHGQRAMVFDRRGEPKKNQTEAACFTAGVNSAGNHSDMDLILQRPRGNNSGGTRAQDGKCPSVTANSFEHNNHVQCVSMRGRHIDENGNRVDIKGAETVQRFEVAETPGKTNCVTTVAKDNLVMHLTGSRVRRLTPVEVCLLFTLPDNYFLDENGKPVISESQMYRCMGNGWVVDVIAHIFSFIKSTHI